MDYFSYSRRRGNSNSGSQDRANAPLPPIPPGTPGTPGPTRPQGQSTTLEGLRQPSSIRIRRLPSGMGTPRPASQQNNLTPTPTQTAATTGRRRSTSEPQRYGGTLEPPAMNLSRQRTVEDSHMTPLAEETPGQRNTRYPRSESSGDYYEATETPPVHDAANGTSPAERVISSASALEEAGNAARGNRGLTRFRTAESARDRGGRPTEDEYHSDVVDLLDLVDPEVRTLGTLTNVQNSLFVPDLGRLVNRRPTYNLTQRPSAAQIESGARRRAGTGAARPTDLSTIPQESRQEAQTTQGDIELQEPIGRRMSISSALSDSRYAVLPHGISLEDWTEEDKAELDDHVRHLMHSRREGFRRSMRGFRQYISKPLGLFVTTYATLVTLFGAAWVFFLIGWIYVGHRQQYIINIVDNVLVALFALMGDGLAPFRAVDTYHMCFIARYHHLTWRLRKERQLPELVDHNDLPLRRQSAAEIEDAIDKEESAEFSVLKPIQQRRLLYHQAKFSKAHTFYRPHETATHHAFPLNLLVAVVVLLDFHSLFQIALGTVTWSWDYHTRPSALTATILCLSLSCNITAGILISVGDHRTRKKDVLERVERQNLTTEAMMRMARERRSEERIAKKSVEVRRAVRERDAEQADAAHKKSLEIGRAAEEQAARERDGRRGEGPSVVVRSPSDEGVEKKDR